MIHRVSSAADLPTVPGRGLESIEPAATQISAARMQSGSAQSQPAPVDRSAIDRVAAKVSEVLDRADSRLKIEIDDETERIVVKVIQGDSGEVIRQIPPEELLELERYLSGGKGLLLEERA